MASKSAMIVVIPDSLHDLLSDPRNRAAMQHLLKSWDGLEGPQRLDLCRVILSAMPSQGITLEATKATGKRSTGTDHGASVQQVREVLGMIHDGRKDILQHRTPDRVEEGGQQWMAVVKLVKWLSGMQEQVAPCGFPNWRGMAKHLLTLHLQTLKSRGTKFTYAALSYGDTLTSFGQEIDSLARVRAYPHDWRIMREEWCAFSGLNPFNHDTTAHQAACCDVVDTMLEVTEVEPGRTAFRAACKAWVTANLTQARDIASSGTWAQERPWLVSEAAKGRFLNSLKAPRKNAVPTLKKSFL